ncbi:MAG: NYN domain-containing protein [Nostocales cyanobacterium 94392]|nr:NYN domain-containing protein [Nostocales cyanobacterium 94392]
MDITNFNAEMQPNKQEQRMKIILADEETRMPKKQASRLKITSNRGRVAIFIDGSNLFHTALQLGIEIDYTKLLCYLTKDARLLRAFFYTGVDRHNEKQQGFLLWMRRNGYRVVTKEIIQLPDGSRKSNQHVEIAVDMMNLSPYYDTAVLVSGDGELTYAVNAVAYQGARVELVSLRAITNESLIDVADCFIDLDTIKHYIKKNSESCCEEI